MQQPASGGAFTRGAYAAAPPKKTQAKYPPLLDSKVRRRLTRSDAILPLHRVRTRARLPLPPHTQNRTGGGETGERLQKGTRDSREFVDNKTSTAAPRRAPQPSLYQTCFRASQIEKSQQRSAK